MMEKATVYKPAVEYTAGTYEKIRSRSFKEAFVNFMEKAFTLGLATGILILSTGIAYKSYVFLKLRSQKEILLKENAMLQQKFEKMTSLETAIKKAKELGLKFPEKKDFIYLRP
jgi:cell division protein FtsL